ncbi:MAG: hypothetical protein KGO47_08250 [Cyanobacteria bacterium REEB417]|nr:hypothetical protein [Cyanobacteria bacterium REEB417]
MIATFAGLFALLAGLVVLLVPLMTPELSRQRDSFWGAVVLLLGLTLVTCSERLAGAPMLAVLCATLLIGRLSLEVSQLRWRLLSPEEQQTLVSAERWQANLKQLAATVARLLATAAEWRDQLGQLITRNSSGLGAGQGSVKSPGKTVGKRWVRPEAETGTTAVDRQMVDHQTVDHLVVRSLAEIDALIQASTSSTAPVASGEAG